MLHIGFAITIIGCLCVVTYLVMNDHPWFALMILIITCSIRMSDDKNKVEDEDKDK